MIHLVGEANGLERQRGHRASFISGIATEPGGSSEFSGGGAIVTLPKPSPAILDRNSGIVRYFGEIHGGREAEFLTCKRQTAHNPAGL